MAPKPKDDTTLDETDKTNAKGDRSFSNGEDAANGNIREPSKVWPETEGNAIEKWLKSWTFSYMRPLLAKGRRQFLDGSHLTQADLFVVPETMKAKDLVATFK